MPTQLNVAAIIRLRTSELGPLAPAPFVFSGVRLRGIAKEDRLEVNEMATI